jgi:CIC family chloride channel protein
MMTGEEPVPERYFSHQPNVPGKGIVASYGLRFWALVAAVGVAAGLGAIAFMELLHTVEHLAWSYHVGNFLEGVQRRSAARRVLVLGIAGAVAGFGALVLRRFRGMGGSEVSESVWLEQGRMAFIPSILRGTLSIVIVGLGASIGREAAPQLAGAAFASSACERARVPAWQRRLLVACGAGAGMAAVYNIPLGGALFACEVLLGTLSLPVVLPALASSAVATAVSWSVLPIAPTYHVPTYGVVTSQIVWAVVVGPLAGLAAAVWVRMVAAAHDSRPAGRLGRLVAPLPVLTALGAIAIAYPQLLGNGKDTVQLAITAGLGVGLFGALMVLKPIVTAACLGSGAPGGLFTPTITYGVLFGGLLGHAWTAVWPGGSAGSYAIVGGTAVLAAAMQGPLAAMVMTIELVHHTEALLVPMLLAVVGATVVARVLGVPSIYSARLGEGAQRGAPGAGTETPPRDEPTPLGAGPPSRAAGPPDGADPVLGEGPLADSEPSAGGT